MNKIIFLDVDGVLNGHEKMSNGYAKMREDCVDNLNYILGFEPQVKIVLISSWRYLVNDLPVDRGTPILENMFLTHGVDCYQRFLGYTDSDEKMADQMGFPRADFNSVEAWYSWIKNYGVTIRRMQVEQYIKENQPDRYVIIDDINLSLSNQIITDEHKGLTIEQAEEVLRFLSNE